MRLYKCGRCGAHIEMQPRDYFVRNPTKAFSSCTAKRTYAEHVKQAFADGSTLAKRGLNHVSLA